MGGKPPTRDGREGGERDDDYVGSWDSQVEYHGEQTTPIATDEGSDLGGCHLTTADHMTHAVYGDHLHCNNGTHLSEGVTGDAMWECHTP